VVSSYLNAVDYASGVDLDYAILEKRYAILRPTRAAALRYVPNKIASMRATTITGSPDRKHVSTSFVERQNLTMRV
jgi:hypothetical protein